MGMFYRILSVPQNNVMDLNNKQTFFIMLFMEFKMVLECL